MNTFKQWKDNAVSLAEAHEKAITVVLVAIALILLGVAFYGKVQHKVSALVYIVL